jgi:hypothetical protein
MGVVAVWLDPDKPGRVAARAIHESLRLLGYEVHVVHSPRDPKLHTNREIKEFLSFDRHSSAAVD